MKLIDLLTSAWAIVPDKLQEIQAIYATHLRGDKIDLAALEARLGRPLANDQQEYTLRDGGVAVLAIDGVISPKANLFTQVSGGVSAQMTLRQVQSLHADPRVRAAVLDIDSPGGSVFGIPAVAAAIRALGQDKPLVAVSSGTMASAAYWWGSAANAVFVSGLTDHLGSIGVVGTHSYQPRTGLQTTEITAGRYKRMASPNQPLSEEGRAYLQAQVDEIYRVFVDAVAEHRGVSADEVLQHMADGRTFIGQQALDAGLADGVATVDEMAAQLARHPQKFAQRRKALFALGPTPAVAPNAPDEPLWPVASQPPEEERNVMPQADTPQAGAITTAQALEAAYPQLVKEIRDQAHSTGAQAERERIQAVRAQSLPGHEALIDKLAFDGQTSGPEAAAAVLAAERSVRQAAVQAHHRDAPAPAPASAAPSDTPAEPSSRDLAKGVLALFNGTRGATRDTTTPGAAQ
jgi:signal peptide peptidase SppA